MARFGPGEARSQKSTWVSHVGGRKPSKQDPQFHSLWNFLRSTCIFFPSNQHTKPSWSGKGGSDGGRSGNLLHLPASPLPECLGSGLSTTNTPQSTPRMLGSGLSTTNTPSVHTKYYKHPSAHTKYYKHPSVYPLWGECFSVLWSESQLTSFSFLL